MKTTNNAVLGLYFAAWAVMVTLAIMLLLSEPVAEDPTEWLMTLLWTKSLGGVLIALSARLGAVIFSTPVGKRMKEFFDL